jgi:heptosyltransferase III
MLFALSKNSQVDHILAVSLSNIGDVILTCPVLDILLNDFPKASISVIVGPKASTLFVNHPRLSTIVYDKQAPFFNQLKWFLNLRRSRFDVIIDLRQSGLGLVLPCQWRTPIAPKPFVGHMKYKHIERLKSVYADATEPFNRQAIVPKPVEQITHLSKYVVIAAGAADHKKRWNAPGFTAVADALVKNGEQVVFVGDKNDVAFIDQIRGGMKESSLSLAGLIDLRELCFVMQNSKFALTHDSGAMHAACYFNVPVVALWGPTDKTKYGPWSSKSVIVHKGEQMDLIKPEDVLDAIAQL